MIMPVGSDRPLLYESVLPSARQRQALSTRETRAVLVAHPPTHGFAYTRKLCKLWGKRMIDKPELLLPALGLLLAASMAGPSHLQAQQVEQQAQLKKESFTVDADLAKKGKKLWEYKGCAGCHTIGKGRSAGPDLIDIHQRRDMDWLMSWLTNTNEMLDTDPIAMQLLADHNNTRMPDLKLKVPDAQALIHFIAQRSEKKKKG